MNSIIDKKHAHEPIERLDPSQISTAVQFLDFMLLNPVAHALLTAKADDEPVTADDRRRFHDGQAWFQEHGGTPMEEVLSEFGLTLDDFPLKKRPIDAAIPVRLAGCRQRGRSRLGSPAAMRIFDGVPHFARPVRVT